MKIGRPGRPMRWKKKCRLTFAWRCMNDGNSEKSAFCSRFEEVGASKRCHTSHVPILPASSYTTNVYRIYVLVYRDIDRYM